MGTFSGGNVGLKTPAILNTEILDIKPEDFTDHHALFVTGALLCVQAVLPDMLGKEARACMQQVTDPHHAAALAHARHVKEAAVLLPLRVEDICVYGGTVDARWLNE